jgi:hypothetical protein
MVVQIIYLKGFLMKISIPNSENYNATLEIQAKKCGLDGVSC